MSSLILRKYLLILLLLCAHVSVAKNNVNDYQRLFLPVYTPDDHLMIAIRVLKMNDVPSFLIVDPDSLQTKVVPIADVKLRNTHHDSKPGYFNYADVMGTRYCQLLNKNTAAPYVTENQGLTHANTNVGNVLTIDLCPSSKAFEAAFFNKLVSLAEQSNKPIPITIAISGMWLIGHPEEFQWLQTKEREKKLAITWANHSFSHIYYHDLPYAENFLLSPASNVPMEILLTEKYLLEEGEVPSVFFRFPGLVSNKVLIKQMKEYGLIPLGTDAWIADMTRRRQEISPGGIILVHGNSNEPEGILRLTPLLDQLTLVAITDAI